MKIIYHLCIIISFTLMAMGEDIKLDPGLRQPDGELKLKKVDKDTKCFTDLLKGRNSETFYNELEKMLSNLGRMTRDDSTIEELAMQMWIYYYITAAPVFQIDIDENTNILRRDDLLDYNVKREAVRNMLRLTLYLDKIKIRHGLGRNDVGTLLGQYAGHIVKQFRENYDKDLPFKIKKMREQHTEDMLKDMLNSEKIRKAGPDGISGGMEQKDRDFLNKLAVSELRNNKIQSSLKDMEEDFVTILVRCFPDKAHEVNKYLLYAGYSKEEIPGLIDRTVGRDSSTEFLYKGKRGRDHGKKP